MEPLSTAGLLQGGWRQECAVLVMPGGADLPYCRHLDGPGTAAIRDFVESGGSYLGLCAGAYFACRRVVFEPGSRLEVVGDRELAFFPGVARGSVYPGFEYESERGAVAAALRFRSAGGQEWARCMDYVNGGPAFEVAAGEGAGVTVLATYSQRAHAVAAVCCAVGRGRAVLCGSHPELHHSWLEAPSGGARGDALRASVPPAGSDSHYQAHVASLSAELEAAEAERRAFWRALLRAAALGRLLRRQDTARLK